jgi:hypothetical protein
MRDSCVEATAPVDTCADRSCGRPVEILSRNFFPFPVLWFAIIALEISLIAALSFAEADIWFHLRNAQQLIIGHSFVHADLYTFTTAGAPLLNFEWLSELPYYLAFQAYGLRGLLAVYLVVLWLIFGGMYYLALRRGANCGDAALVTMALVIPGSYSFGPRMLHFGWLCLTAELIVLERFQRTGKGLWALPPLFALWINLHGSWVFGLVVLGIYIVSGLVEGRWGSVSAERWTPAQLRKLVVIVVASSAAILVNPYGYKLVWYPFDLLFRQQPVLDKIVEWQSVDFHTGYGKLAMLMILALLAATLLSPFRWELRDVLLVTFAVGTSLTHIRFLLFAAIILIPVLAPRVHVFALYDRKKDKPWLNLAMTAAIMGLALWAYPSTAQLQNSVDSYFPRAALQFVQQKQIGGRLFHFYDYGGYIEWNAPTVRTFADGRADIFIYNGVFDDYLKVNRIEKPLELLDKYRIDYVLFPIDKPLCHVLDHSAGWHTIYEDKVAKIYGRVPSAAAPLKAETD